MSEKDSESIKVLEDRFQHLYKEYNKKMRKLQKSKRAAEARAYVQQRLKEEAAQTETANHQASSSRKPCNKSERFRGKKSTHVRSTKQKSGDLCNEKCKLQAPQKSLDAENQVNDVPAREVRLLGNSVTKNPGQSQSNVVASKTEESVGVGCITPEENIDDENQEDNIGGMNQDNKIKDENITDKNKNQTDKIRSENHEDKIGNENHEDKIGNENHEDKIGNENQENLDISTESQDIFISPLKQVDQNKFTCVHAQTDTDVDTDLVIIEQEDEEQDQNTGRYRPKSSVSKLKLSKYKKNFVNPVRKGNIHNEQKIKSYCVDSEHIYKSSSELGTEDQQGSVVSFDGPEIALKRSVARVCEGLHSELQGYAKKKGDVLAKDQGAVYSVGQVIVFERQVSENKEKRQKKLENVKRHRSKKNNILDQMRDATASLVANQTHSETQSTSESSLSTAFDDDHMAQFEDEIKTRRRSGSRKRRSSSQGAQRKSSRLSGQSSQESWSQSTESEVISPLFVNAGHSSAKKRVIISSVFQCLVDEGRRKNDVEEFCVPPDFVKCGYEEKSPAESSTHLPHLNLSTTESHITNVEVEESDTDKTATSKYEILEKTEKVDLQLPVPDTMNCLSTSENEGINSPTLFESQTDTFKFDKDIGRKDAKEYKSTEKKQNEIEHQSQEDNCESEFNVTSQAYNGINCVDTEQSCLCLHQTACFQVPKSDNVQSLLCIEIGQNDQVTPYVVCLCSSCLKLYTVCNNQWTCVATSKLGFISRKKSGNVMYCLPDTDIVSVIILGSKSDCTCINMYTHAKQEWQHTTLDKIFSRSIQVCPLSQRGIVTSYRAGEMMYLCKYSQERESGQWSSKQLGSTDKHITQLLAVKGIDAAVLAITKDAELQIWNHEYGYLLSTVDISDVCPSDPACPVAFSEQGFLFLPLLMKKKSSGPGSVVVINLYMSASEVLTSINMQDPWTGCSNTCVMSNGLLLCRQNNGCVRVWNVYTGSLLATVDDVTVTCFSATNQHFAIAHKQCIHLYKLIVPSLL